jgi:hypothetical protein
MTSGEFFENMWFYMKYIGKYFSAARLLISECLNMSILIGKNIK